MYKWKNKILEFYICVLSLERKSSKDHVSSRFHVSTTISFRVIDLKFIKKMDFYFRIFRQTFFFFFALTQYTIHRSPPCTLPDHPTKMKRSRRKRCGSFVKGICLGTLWQVWVTHNVRVPFECRVALHFSPSPTKTDYPTKIRSITA